MYKENQYLEHWKAFSDYLCWKNLNCEILELHSLTMPFDGKPARYVFDKPYQILVLSRNNWSNIAMHIGKNCSVWYTDGSKMDASTGNGICCPDEHLKNQIVVNYVRHLIVCT